MAKMKVALVILFSARSVAALSGCFLHASHRAYFGERWAVGMNVSTNDNFNDCSGTAYTDCAIYNHQYGSNFHQGHPDIPIWPLLLDVYFPALPGNGDAQAMRAVAVLQHGGGFLESGRYQFIGETAAQLAAREHGKDESAGEHKLQVRMFCQRFVKHNIACVSIEYRCMGETNPALNVITAAEDAKAALRYVKFRAASWRLDSDYMMLMGDSAGALSVLHTVYDNAMLPDGGNSGSGKDVVNDASGTPVAGANWTDLKAVTEVSGTLGHIQTCCQPTWAAYSQYCLVDGPNRSPPCSMQHCVGTHGGNGPHIIGSWSASPAMRSLTPVAVVHGEYDCLYPVESGQAIYDKALQRYNAPQFEWPTGSGTMLRHLRAAPFLSILSGAGHDPADMWMHPKAGYFYTYLAWLIPTMGLTNDCSSGANAAHVYSGTARYDHGYPAGFMDAHGGGKRREEDVFV